MECEENECNDDHVDNDEYNSEEFDSRNRCEPDESFFGMGMGKIITNHGMTMLWYQSRQREYGECC